MVFKHSKVSGQTAAACFQSGPKNQASLANSVTTGKHCPASWSDGAFMKRWDRVLVSVTWLLVTAGLLDP